MGVYLTGIKDSSVRRMGRNFLEARIAPRTLRELIMSLNKFLDNEPEVRSMYPWADRFVMGLPLAPWQRPAVWTELQKVKFIESLWCGVDVGAYIVNETEAYVETKDQFYMAPLSDIIIDGQQRLTALQDYFLNSFAVPDRDGILVKWSELSNLEQRFFSSTIFSRGTVKSTNEKDLRELYDIMAFGGTPHLPTERASS